MPLVACRSAVTTSRRLTFKPGFVARAPRGGWPGVTSRSTILPSRIVENASARPVGERDGLTQQLTVGGDAMIHTRATLHPCPQRHASGSASAHRMALGFI